MTEHRSLYTPSRPALDIAWMRKRLLSVYARLYAPQPAFAREGLALLFHDDGSEAAFRLSSCPHLQCQIDLIKLEIRQGAAPSGLGIVIPGMTSNPAQGDTFLYLEHLPMPAIHQVGRIEQILACDYEPDHQPDLVTCNTSFPFDILARILAAEEGLLPNVKNGDLYLDTEIPKALRRPVQSSKQGALH